MSVLQALILGLLQGLTEFLPVSSSGHIELGKVLLQVDEVDNVTFSVMVHAATVLSTIIVFRRDIAGLLVGLLALRWNDDTRYVGLLLLSMLPVGIVGLFFKDEVEAFFTGNLLLVGLMLWVTALLLILSMKLPHRHEGIKPTNALLIGLAQAVAVLPGISRSGATISTALMLGVDRAQAARFSFLMVLAPILGATLLEVKDLLEAPQAGGGDAGWLPLGVGFLAAFLSGVIACQWMIALVRRAQLSYFALYCALIGSTAIVFALL
jgi:undecaprenyl-diphosphatase